MRSQDFSFFLSCTTNVFVAVLRRWSSSGGTVGSDVSWLSVTASNSGHLMTNTGWPVSSWVVRWPADDQPCVWWTPTSTHLVTYYLTTRHTHSWATDHPRINLYYVVDSCSQCQWRRQSLSENGSTITFITLHIISVNNCVSTPINSHYRLHVAYCRPTYLTQNVPTITVVNIAMLQALQCFLQDFFWAYSHAITHFALSINKLQNIRNDDVSF